jgi:hypothetical protein
MTGTIQRILKGFTVVVLAAVVLFAGCSNGNASASTNGGDIDKASGPAIGISPSVITVNEGEDFDVNVMVKMPTPITAVGCQLKWTASDAAGTGKIECVDKVESGNFMTANIGSIDERGNFEANPDSKDKPLMVGGSYDPAAGTTGQVAVTIVGENKGVKGDGTFLTFHFKALQKGEVTLELFDTQVADTQQALIDTKSYNGKVVIQ